MKQWQVTVWRYDQGNCYASPLEFTFDRKRDAINTYNLCTYAMGLGKGHKPKGGERLTHDGCNAVEFFAPF